MIKFADADVVKTVNPAIQITTLRNNIDKSEWKTVNPKRNKPNGQRVTNRLNL